MKVAGQTRTLTYLYHERRQRKAPETNASYRRSLAAREHFFGSLYAGPATTQLSYFLESNYERQAL
jgi:hypothetical protein